MANPTTDLSVMTVREKEALGHQYLRVSYVTIQGTGGSHRLWGFELPAWLAKRPGTLIVRLEVS